LNFGEDSFARYTTLPGSVLESTSMGQLIVSYMNDEGYNIDSSTKEYLLSGGASGRFSPLWSANGYNDLTE